MSQRQENFFPFRKILKAGRDKFQHLRACTQTLQVVPLNSANPGLAFHPVSGLCWRCLAQHICHVRSGEPRLGERGSPRGTVTLAVVNWGRETDGTFFALTAPLSKVSSLLTCWGRWFSSSKSILQRLWNPQTWGPESGIEVRLLFPHGVLWRRGG